MKFFEKSRIFSSPLRRGKIIISLVFILAVFLITFHFTDTPRVWVDEGIYTNVAESVASSGTFGIQTSPGQFFKFGPLLTTNYPLIFSVALSFKLFGIGLWQARLPMIIYMFLLVIFFYLFAKKRYGFYPAVSSVLLLISFAPFYGDGRSVLGEVPGLVFLMLGALFLLHLEEGGFESRKLAIFSGLFLGLAASTKTLYLLLLVAILPATLLFWFWIKKIKNKSGIYPGASPGQAELASLALAAASRGVFNPYIKTSLGSNERSTVHSPLARFNKKNILLLLGIFFIPIFFWFVINVPTPDLIAKLIPTIVHQSGNNGGSTLSDTSLSPIRTVLVNLKRFVTESTPILFLFLFVSVLLSIALKFFQKRERNFSISECLIFLVVVCNWLGYLPGTGWYRYFFPAHVLLYLFFPAALITLGNLWKPEFSKKIVVSIIILLTLFQFYYLVFLSDTPLVYTSQRNIDMAKALSVISSRKKVLFYNTIDSIVFLKGDNYSQYLTMPGLFEAGDRKAISDTSYDFLLTDNTQEIKNTVSSCYTSKEVGKYLLFQKTTACGK